MYRINETSPYRQLKYATKKRDYDPALRLIEKSAGRAAINALTGDDFRRWYEGWGKEGKKHRAHNAIRKLGIITSYGVTQRYQDCIVAREILSLMRFEAPKPRHVKMERRHAQAIVRLAIGDRKTLDCPHTGYTVGYGPAQDRYHWFMATGQER